VSVVAVNYCWSTKTKVFRVAYSTGTTRLEEWLEGRDSDEKQLSEEDLLRRIASLEAIDLSELDEIEGVYAPPEEEVLFQQLVDWAQPKAFRKAVAACMKQLEETIRRIDYAF
jgi:hypothetical protein